MFDFEQNQIKMTDFYVEGHKMAGNRQTQKQIQNSKIVSDLNSLGRLNSVYLKNS
jgi:hypothetical protein